MTSVRTYAALDLGFAALYAVCAIAAPASGPGARILVLTFAAALTATAVGLLLRARWARIVGILTCVALLVVALAAVALLVASAAYLHGIFGVTGEGFALLCLVAAALVVELMVLLPAFQLRFLFRADVRRSLAP